MAISATGGTSANSSSAVSSLALPSYTTHSGQDLAFVIALGATASSVSGISASAGSYGTATLQSFVNGTGVRVEVWTIHVTTGAATVFTINITGGATSIAAGLEEYSGVSAWGHTGTATGSTVNIDGTVATQQGNDWTIGGMAFACQSGDTLTATAGNSRQSTIPAATAVGIGLYDATGAIDETMRLQSRISAARNWAFAAVEAESGSAAFTAGVYGGATVAALDQNKDIRYLTCVEPLFAQSNTGIGTPVSVGSILQSATVGVAYSETLSVQSGTSPYSFSITSGALPSGLSLNSSTGVISGTPTTAATYTFTVRVSDALGRTNSQSFQIITSTASGGGEFSYSYGG